MSEDVKVDFDQMAEPSQQKYISEAGIYRNVLVTKMGIAPITEKDGKKSGGFLEIVIESAEYGMFTIKHWPLPKTPDEVKFVMKVYGPNGEELRDRTKEEQLNADHVEFAYFLCQLGMAWNNPFDNVKRIVIVEKTFETMIGAFIKAFFTDQARKSPIDVKLVWNNNIKDKKSFLQIAKATQKNVVFRPYLKSLAKSDLEFTAYEKKKKMLICEFPYAKPATGAASNGSGATQPTGDWKPPANPGAALGIEALPDGNLF